MALVVDDAHGNMPSWLDSEFLQKIMRESTHDDRLTVEKSSARGATGKGDNYASDMHRVEVSVRLGNGSIQKRSLIVKLPPIAEELSRVVIEAGFFDREISMFGVTLPRITALLEEKGPFATALYTRVDPSPLLILDDLSVEGYRMAQRTQGLDLDHANLCMRALGRYHAATIALSHSEPSLLEPYRLSMYDDIDMKESVENFLGSSLRTLAEEVKSWPEVGQDYAARLRKLTQTARGKMISSFEVNPEDFQVLIHGDLWVNNMLFHYNDKGDVDDVKFVDFQLTTIASPAIDLNYFLYTSLSDDLRRENSDFLLHEYHSSLCDTMDKLGLSQHKPSFGQILQDCDRKAFHALYSAVCVWPIVMCKSEDGFDIEALIKGTDGDPSKIWGNKTLNAGIKRLLPEFDKKGLF